jgi:EpsD family peptidyl-prolyl cis-trans isomerase
MMSCMATMMRRHGTLIVILVLSCLCLVTPASSEAGGGNDSTAAAPGNRIVAIVDGVEITAAELERRILAAFGDNPASETSETIKAAALRSLIQERVAERLVSPKEITPSMQEEMDVSRRRILLNHFLDKNAARATQPPTEKDVEKYIAENPGYFDRRKTYHYAEMIIKTASPAIERAVDERLQQLVVLKDPTVKDLQLVRDWLRQNNVMFGDSSVWRSTEQIPVDTLKTIDFLDQSKGHVSIERAKLFFKVVVLFGSYPDPLTPELSKFDAFQRLANVAIARSRALIIDKALATADVEITDPKLAKLIMPADATGAPRPKPHPMRKLWSFDSNMLLLAWCFAALVLGPLALYQFYVQPQPRTDTPPNRLVDLSYHRGVRLMGVALGALALLVPAVLIIKDHLHDGEMALVRSALVGIAAAAVTAVLFAKSLRLKSLSASRGAAFLAVFLIQMLLILALDPFSGS